MAKRGKNTELSRVAEGPSVKFYAAGDGVISAVLKCYCIKDNGGYENITIQFNRLTVESVACIGNHAREAIDNAGRNFWACTREAIKRVKGEG